MIADTERLNFLQALTDKRGYTGLVILRASTTGRGWRLHETSDALACRSVRDAIDQYRASFDTEPFDTGPSDTEPFGADEDEYWSGLPSLGGLA